MPHELTLGVSACLLGQAVRYDGGHKHDRYVTDLLGRYFRLLPVCPEVECGMPTPREPMRLEGDPAAPRLMTIRSRVDMTEQMQTYCTGKVAELAAKKLCGFIFKKDSPSSGLYRVKVYVDGGMPRKQGSGLFAAAVRHSLPLLPLEEEGRLNDPDIRENFLSRVFGYHRLTTYLADAPSLGGLVAFHTAHKLLLMAHSPQLYRETGRLVAGCGEHPLSELLAVYAELFMRALSLHATRRKQTNVLQHLAGYFKRALSADDKKELQELISRYHAGLTPLVAPLTLLKHYVRKYDATYLQGQVYLDPYPAELMLRNHV